MTAVRRIVQALDAAPTFEALYDRHVDGVWRLLQRFGVPESGLEDAVQEVFLVAHRQREGFRGDSTEKTWLFGIALRVAKDVRRALGRRGIQEALEDHLHLRSEPQLEEATMHRQALAQVLALLQQLDDGQREVFVLAELEGLTAPEIGEATGVNVNTVYTRLRAARQRFNALVAQKGGVQR